MKQEVSALVAIRDVTAQDTNFIMSTWLKGLRHGNDWFEIIPSDIYYASYHKVLERILMKSETIISMACLKEDPDTIIGYSVKEGDTLHFVYVRSRWRGKGIAKSLIPESIKQVTHLTKIGKALLSKTPGVIFNPFYER